MTTDPTIGPGHLAVRAVNGARRYRFGRDVFMTLMRVQRRRAFQRLRDDPHQDDAAVRREPGSVKGMQ